MTGGERYWRDKWLEESNKVIRLQEEIDDLKKMLEESRKALTRTKT